MFDFIDTIIRDHTGKKEQKAISDVNIAGDSATQFSWGDQETLTKVYENAEIVYRCISFIASNLSQVKLKVIKKQKDNIIDISDNKEFSIFYNPNKFQTQYDFWYESFSRLELQGELFWPMEINGSGKPLSIYADWKSENVKIVPSATELIDHFILTRNGKEFKFLPEEVFYIKYFNPYNSLRGMSALRSSRDSLTLDFNAVDFNKKFFKQGLKLSGILQTENELKPAEADRMKKTFESTYSGAENMNKVAVLWGGLKFDPVQKMSLSDAQFMELRNMNEQKILYSFGLYAEVVGIAKSATYENVKYYRRMVWTETLIPKLNKIVSAMNKFILPRLTKDPNVSIEYDISEIEALKEDRSQKIKDYQVGVELGVISRNEMRNDVFGKEEYADEAMDDPTTNVQSQGALVDPAAKSETSKFLNPETYEERTKAWEKTIKKTDSLESKFLKFIKTYFRQQEKRIIKNVDLSLKIVKVDLVSESVFFDYEKEKKLLIKDGTKEILTVFAASVDELYSALESGTFDYELPSVRMALGQRVAQFSRFVSDTTDIKIQEEIAKVFSKYGTEDLATIKSELKKSVSKLYKGFTEGRAATIARTEVMGAWNMGQQEAIVQSKRANKMWITSRDQNVRDSHQIDGQVVKALQSFTLADGSQMLYPHDYNERCIEIGTTLPVTKT